MKLLNSMKSMAFIIGCGISTSVLSAPITFDFSQYRSYSSVGHTYMGSDGEQSVYVTPESQAGTPYLASSKRHGLYITTCQSYYRCNDNHQIDGKGPNEAAVLDFGKEVKLLSAKFSYIGSNDDFTLLVDGEKKYENVGFDKIYKRHYSNFYFDDFTVGSEFAFLAEGRNDDFKLYSVTADFVSNVPEPATLSLLGLGLAALGSIRRRKS